MKTILFILAFCSSLTLYGQLSGGNVLLMSDGFPTESQDRHFFNTNLTATGNRTHNGNNKTITINSLGGWTMTSGTGDVSYGSLGLDSLVFAIDAPDINIDATDDLFLLGGPASVSTIFLMDTGIEIENNDGVIKITSLPVYADDTAAGVGGLTAGRIYRTSTGELRIKL